jgi:hypothetical protein
MDLKRIHEAWDEALGSKDLEAAMGPDAQDATDGTTLILEYPRSTSDGEQMDFVEVMEVADGLIRAHRVYWGWRGLKGARAERLLARVAAAPQGNRRCYKTREARCTTSTT